MTGGVARRDMTKMIGGDAVTSQARPLEELSLAELWELFPIQLRPHDPRWQAWYDEEAGDLRSLFGEQVARLSHIGSTSVPGLLAKPIVDLLLETADPRDPQSLVDGLAAHGWRLMARSDDPFRLDLNKGYTPQGFADKVFHLHVVRPGDNDELYFRDWLLDHPQTCAQYEDVKRRLFRSYEHDRDAYTAGKTDFITAVTRQARQTYRGRY